MKNETGYSDRKGGGATAARRGETRLRGGFSLMEVLLAVFILGIGLIMVATIFPVGADWARQSTEDSIAQTVAQNAVSVIQTAYARDSLNPNAATNASLLAALSTSKVVALPNLTLIPVAERCYQFGNPSPFPAAAPVNCTYYWSALVRVQPGQGAGTTGPRRYDLYVLVFRKGDASQTFNLTGLTGTEVPGARDQTTPMNSTMDYHLEPTLLSGIYSTGTYNASLSPPVSGAFPPIGAIGIGETSGTVFRQGTATDFSAGTTVGVARPAVITGGNPENVFYGAPADNTSASPLIYVYQTTLSF